jgi:hypothetical protein
MNLKTLLAALLAALIVSTAATADVLLIEDVERAKTMSLPDNGLNKQQVSQRWGEPLQRYAAVGAPPITRWRYDGYSVYFEYDRVISTVLHHDSDRGQ